MTKIAIGTTLENRYGDIITTTLTNEEAFARVAAHADANNWLAFYVHRMANELGDGVPRFTHVVETIGCMFLYAIGQGLKKPRIRVAYNDIRYRMYLSARGTLCIRAASLVPGAQNDWQAESYVGCIWQGKLRADNMRPEWQDFMDTMVGSDDLTGFLAQCSKDLGACCYCNQPLDHEYSKAVGYGETCAQRWGLPWGKKAHDDKAPHIFRLLGNPEIRSLMAMVRENPRDADRWEVLGDRLEEAGLKRPKMPAKSTVCPS